MTVTEERAPRPRPARPIAPDPPRVVVSTHFPSADRFGNFVSAASAVVTADVRWGRRPLGVSALMHRDHPAPEAGSVSAQPPRIGPACLAAAPGRSDGR